MAAQPPSHSAYQVRKYKSGGEEKSYWTKIGSVWAHGDGQGFNIRLSALPVDGEIVVRPIKEKKAEGADDAAIEGDNSVPK